MSFDYIARIYPQDLVNKPDSWCEQYVIGAHQGALKFQTPENVKKAVKRRVLGMPYRTVETHAWYIKQKRGVVPNNWTPGLKAKQILIKAGWTPSLPTPAATVADA